MMELFEGARERLSRQEHDSSMTGGRLDECCSGLEAQAACFVDYCKASVLPPARRSACHSASDGAACSPVRR